MAKLFNLKSETWKGEACVYEALEKLLPNEIVCYYNGQILAHTFDYCLVIKNMGILIIEVKGWHPSHIDHFDDLHKQIYFKDNPTPFSSPKVQADGYRYGLVHIFNKNYNINPLIVSTVCYPFIDENEFLSIGLKGFSELEYTILKDDLNDRNKLIGKISNIFKALSSNKTDKLNGVIYDTVRNHFEFNYKEISEHSLYSSLKIFNTKVSVTDFKKIFEEYARGIKQIIFVKTTEELEEFKNELNQFYDSKSLFYKNGCFTIEKSQKSNLKISNNRINSFIFEVYLINLNSEISKNIIIENGNTNADDEKLLNQLVMNCDFNLEQYKIEHFDTNSNIQIKAGAGTGKTYSMISRISYLCNRSSKSGIIDMANEIAMLTFTEEAATNMRVRIKQQFLNYFCLTRNKTYLDMVSAVERMRISTIHSFAKDIISRTSLPIGIGADFSTLVGDFTRKQILKKHLNSFFEGKVKDDSNYVYNLKISTIYDLEKYLMEFSNKCFNKGIDLKTLTEESLGRPIKEYEYIVDLIINVLKEAEIEYSNTLLEANTIHLNEYMIYLKKCIEDESFNSSLYKYKYMFIDEFQDVDDGQIDIFKTLYSKLKAKLFIVGDLKQSIYRFRGATLDAFSKICSDEITWSKFSLCKNYRSDKRLLDEFDKVFKKFGSKGFLPYGVDDILIGVKTNKYLKGKILEKVPLENYCGEKVDKYETLFKKIVARKKELEEIMTYTSLSKNERTIAILVRNNSDIKNILRNAQNSNILRDNNITIESNKNVNLYSLQSTIDLCKLTSALCNPYNEQYLFDLVMSNNVDVNFYATNLINKTVEEKRKILIDCLDLFYTSTLNLKWVELVNRIETKPTLMVLREIYEASKPWKKYSNDYNKQIYYRINYEALFEELSRTNKYNFLTLDSINESLYINITTENEAKSRALENDGMEIKVICMTVHASKGLEFDTVILPEVGRKIGNYKKNTIEITYDNGKLGYCFNIGDNLTPIFNEYFDEKNEKKEIIMEETRILYVALTRAINKVIWFGKQYDNNLSWNKLLDGDF